jgi:hypothetical protein
MMLGFVVSVNHLNQMIRLCKHSSLGPSVDAALQKMQSVKMMIVMIGSVTIHHKGTMHELLLGIRVRVVVR